MARLSLRLLNVGFRNAHSTVRVEPAETSWVKLLAGQDGRMLETIDQTEIPVEIELPETIEELHGALIIVESNGGTRRVEYESSGPPRRCSRGRRAGDRRFGDSDPGEGDFDFGSQWSGQLPGQPSAAAGLWGCGCSLRRECLAAGRRR